MNKKGLIELIVEQSGVTTAQAKSMLDIFTSAMSRSLEEGEQVSLVGFGNFGARKRSARIGRNPRTGDPIDIPAAWRPYFTPAKQLKEAVNRALSEKEA